MERITPVGGLCAVPLMLAVALLLAGPADAQTAAPGVEGPVAGEVEKGPPPVTLGELEASGNFEAEDGFGTPESGSSSSSCDSYNFCYWPYIDFVGSPKRSAGTAVAGIFISLEGYRSGKNRFGNRRVRLWDYYGGFYFLKGCINAGGNDRNFPLAADTYKIGAQGISC